MNIRQSPSGLTGLVAGGALALALLSAPALSQAGEPAGARDLAALVDRMPRCDPDGKHTGPAPEAAEEVYREILRRGRDSPVAAVKGLVNMLVEPGKGEDYKARYLLHGLVTYVTRRESRAGSRAERRTVGEALVSSLGDVSSANVKAFVVGELQFLGERRAVRPLGKLLLDDALCDCAARALVSIGGEAVVQLRRALPAARQRNRVAIIQALGELRDSRSVTALIALLRDRASGTRVAAAAALSKIADARAVRPLLRALDAADGYETTQMADACFVLAQNLLDAASSGQRGRPRRYVERRAGARDEAFRMYRHVWRALVGSGEPQMRHAVVEGLAAAFGSDSTGSLVRRLRTGDSATRAAILHALGRRATATAFPAVAAAMEDEDPWVRLVAMLALGPVGEEKSVPLLVGALPGKGSEESQVLRTALLNVPGEGSNRAIAKGLAGVPDGPGSSAVRIVLLDTLATRRASEGAEAAFALTGDADAAVRVEALKALARIADGSCAPRLVGLLPKVKQPEELRVLEDALLESCRRISSEKQRLKALLPALASGDVRARCTLLRVTGRIGTAGSVSVLLEALEDGDAEVRDTATRSLSEFPNDRPAAKLLEIAGTTSDLKHQVLALRGYVRMAEKKRKNEDKLRMMREAMAVAKRPEERKLVLGSMGKVRTVESLESVLPYIGEPGISEEAGRAAYDIARRLDKRHAGAVREAMEKVIAHVRGERLRRDAKGLLAKMRAVKAK